LEKIIIATGNKDKFSEIKEIWKNIDIDISWLGQYPEMESVEETASTLKGNALLKAKYSYERLGYPSVADDTGLFVEYLNGSPGVYSSRYAGEEATYEDNVDKLLLELKGVPHEKRKAEFRCAVCLYKGDEPVFTEGVVPGFITEKRKGNEGFGYDPVFQLASSGKTFATMSPEEKNSISHRYISFKKMGTIIKNFKKVGK